MTLEISLRHRFPGAEGFTLDAAFIAPGTGVTALFGPSGCGKTSILAAVAGLLRPAAGRIVHDGVTLLDTGARIAEPPERRRCGVVFQDARLFPHLSVEANLRFGQRRAPRGATGPDFATVVDLLDIAALLDRRPLGLSGGERQRVALGRALLARPRLLLMDEPLAALDTPRRAEILPFLARLRDAAGLPILYVTHALDEVDALADTLVLLEAGRVVAAGPVETLAARTDLPALGTRRDAGVLLVCGVRGHDPVRGLTALDFAGGTLRVPLRAGLAAGARVRLRVRARDVAVATARPSGLSIQNVLPCRLAAIEPAPGAPHEAFLRLRIGASTLLARVTSDAVATLGLAPGMALFALVKSVAFDDRATSADPPPPAPLPASGNPRDLPTAPLPGPDPVTPRSP